jgi:hypothetical protein
MSMTEVTFVIDGKEHYVDSFTVVGYNIVRVEQRPGHYARLFLELPKSPDAQQAVKGEVTFAPRN